MEIESPIETAMSCIAAPPHPHLLTLPNEIVDHILGDAFFRSQFPDPFDQLSLLLPLRGVCKSFYSVIEQKRDRIAHMLRRKYKSPKKLKFIISTTLSLVNYINVGSVSESLVGELVKSISVQSCFGYLHSNIQPRHSRGALFLAQLLVEIAPQPCSAVVFPEDFESTLPTGYFSLQVLLRAAATGDTDFFDFVANNVDSRVVAQMQTSSFQHELLLAVVGAPSEATALTMLNHILPQPDYYQKSAQVNSTSSVLKYKILDYALNMDHTKPKELAELLGERLYFEVFCFFRERGLLRCSGHCCAGFNLSVPSCPCSRFLASALRTRDDPDLICKAHDQIESLRKSEPYALELCPLHGEGCLNHLQLCQNVVLESCLRHDRVSTLKAALEKWKWNLGLTHFYTAIAYKATKCFQLLCGHELLADAIHGLTPKDLYQCQPDFETLALLLQCHPKFVANGLVMNLFHRLLFNFLLNRCKTEEVVLFVSGILVPLHRLGLLPDAVVAAYAPTIQKVIEDFRADTQDFVASYFCQTGFLLPLLPTDLREGNPTNRVYKATITKLLKNSPSLLGKRNRPDTLSAV